MRTTVRLGWVILGFMFCLCLVALEGRPEKWVFPFRILDKDSASPELLRRVLDLRINGNPTEIESLVEKQERLGKPSPLGRNFVLSFQLNEYNQGVRDCFSYFAHRILDPRDTLMVLTPLKSYHIRVQGNKEAVVADVETLLKEDSQVFTKDKKIAERKLKNMLDQLEDIMSDRSRSSGFNVQKYKDINRFLNVFPQEFQKYRNLFLIPHVGKYSQILKPFRMLEGERWWIHFQQRETSDLVSKTGQVINRINDYFKEDVSHYSRMISHVESLLDLLQSFPVEQILDPLIDYNFCFNVVLFGGMSSQENEPVIGESASLLSIMGDISRKCGGRIITTIDAKDGLKELEKYQNSYFELDFQYEGRGKAMDIVLLYENKKHDLVYKKKMTAEEIDDWDRYLKTEKIAIEGVVVDGNMIKFSIRSFSLDEKNKIGMIRVSLTLIDGQGLNRFESARTLRASEKSVSISLLLPVELKGNFHLLIQAIDIIGNRLTRSESTICL
jgi:hypothetical protein